MQNLKLSQYDAGIVVDDVFVMSVTNHKTNVGHGSARLMLKPATRQRLSTYVSVIRPLMANPEVDNVFVMPDGNKVYKIQNIARFMESELRITVPSATQVRKIGATKVFGE